MPQNLNDAKSSAGPLAVVAAVVVVSAAIAYIAYVNNAGGALISVKPPPPTPILGAPTVSPTTIVRPPAMLRAPKKALSLKPRKP